MAFIQGVKKLKIIIKNDLHFVEELGLIYILDRGVVVKALPVELAALVRVHVPELAALDALGLAYLQKKVF